MRARMKYLTSIAYLTLLGLVACGHGRRTPAVVVPQTEGPAARRLVVSLAEQMMVTLEDDKPRRLYRVSTSRFGTGDKRGTYFTPLGRLEIVEIVGQGLPVGAKLKARQQTGEIVPVDAPGRDPIVTRILWLEGMEPGNRNAFSRGIYIHGTPQEKLLGRPASYGCIRMKSSDVAVLCDRVTTGATVRIIPDHLPEHAGFGGFLNAHRLVAANTSAPESASEKEAE